MRRAAVILVLLLGACATEPAKRPTYRIHVPAEATAQAVPAPAPEPPAVARTPAEEMDAVRAEAMAAHDTGDSRAALEKLERARELARDLPTDDWRLIENYDDAGLYHFTLGEFREAAQHQSIAVLLSCGGESVRMFRDAMTRLALAWEKYRPGDDFARIAKDPLVLLLDRELELRSNRDIHRRYFFDAPGDARAACRAMNHPG